MVFLVTGGSASGKSAYAEQICTQFEGKRAYIATMQPFGNDGKYRIERHRRLRVGKGFSTVEQYTDIAAITRKVDKDIKNILIECMSNLCANEMFSPEGIKENTAQHIYDGILKLKDNFENIVIVTNDVFSDGIEYDSQTADYISELGLLNRMLAEKSDSVLEVFYSLPVVLKDQNGYLKKILCIED